MRGIKWTATGTISFYGDTMKERLKDVMEYQPLKHENVYFEKIRITGDTQKGKYGTMCAPINAIVSLFGEDKGPYSAIIHNMNADDVSMCAGCILEEHEVGYIDIELKEEVKA